MLLDLARFGAEALFMSILVRSTSEWFLTISALVWSQASVQVQVVFETMQPFESLATEIAD